MNVGFPCTPIGIHAFDFRWLQTANPVVLKEPHPLPRALTPKGAAWARDVVASVRASGHRDSPGANHGEDE
jgi:hypothetical protein